MTQVSIEHLPVDTELTDVKSEQIRILFDAIPSFLFAILVCSTILSIAQWQIIDHDTIVAWIAITNLLSLLRLLTYQQFKREQRSRLVDSNWTQRAIIASLASGATWGAAAFSCLPSSARYTRYFSSLSSPGSVPAL